MHSGSRHRELLEQVRVDYPAPIAEAARNWQFASDENRLNEALFLSRALILTLATASVAWCRSVFLEPHGVMDLLQSCKRRSPTLGRWARVARDGAKLARGNGFELCGFAEALGGDGSQLWAGLEALVQWRNSYGGGGGSGLRGTATLAQVEEFETLLLDALCHSAFLSTMRFALIESSELQRRNRQFLIRYRKVHGDHPVLEPGTPFEYPEPFISRSLYLLLAPGQDIDLTPLWTMQPCKHCRHPELCYLVRIKPERLEYASFSTNHTAADRKLAAEIEWFNGDLITSKRFQEVPSLATLAQPDRLTTRRTLPVNLINLPHLYRQTQATMVKAVHADVRHGYTGWNHRLGLPGVTAAGTAMGLRAMRIVGDDFDIFNTDDLIETIWRMRRADMCWSFTSQAPVGRPEATAMVLLTLRMYDRWEYIAQVTEQFQRILPRANDPMLWRHVDPTSERIAATIAKLYQSHRQGVWDWGEMQRPVWATLDALRALETYALRASPYRVLQPSEATT
jgi:hypothetical protein